MTGYKFNAASDSAEIMLYGTIGDDWDGVTAKQFATDLKAAGKCKSLTVRINSIGGNVDDGMAIYNTLRTCGATVNTVVEGFACSSAATVAMAGDKITMYESGVLMIHNAWGFAAGEAADFRKQAEVLDLLSEQIAKVYSARSGQALAKVQDMMAAETWMTPTEAIDLGFATEQIANKASLAAMPRGLFRNAPKWAQELKAETVDETPWRVKMARRRLSLLTIAQP